MADPVGGDDQPPQPEVDGGVSPVPRMCSTSDPSLKLCIDFDDESNLAFDALGHAVDALNLSPMKRDAQGTLEGAVEVDAQSHLWIAETPDLDIEEDLTVSMWIDVDIGGLPITNSNARWLFDNNTQYFAALRVGGVIRCGSGSVVVDTPALGANGTWRHVACTYKDDELRVYVDGHVAGCESTSERDVPTGGTNGFAIGANLGGGTGPKYSEQFVGGIDNVQVFSRLVEPAELCAAAGGTTCNTTCP